MKASLKWCEAEEEGEGEGEEAGQDGAAVWGVLPRRGERGYQRDRSLKFCCAQSMVSRPVGVGGGRGG